MIRHQGKLSKKNNTGVKKTLITLDLKDIFLNKFKTKHIIIKDFIEQLVIDQ